MSVENPVAMQLKRNLAAYLEANRMLVLLAVSMSANLVLVFGLAGLMPLKERIPYFVVSNKETGAVQVSTNVAQKFVPDEQNIKYFSAKFVRELLTIDPYRSKSEFFPDVKTMVLGKGKSQVNDFFHTDNTFERMDKDPSLIRNVALQRITILPDAENEVMVTVKLTTMSNNGSEQSVTRMVTLHYALEPVKSDAEALRNPIGFFVTQFVIDQELGQ